MCHSLLYPDFKEFINTPEFLLLKIAVISDQRFCKWQDVLKCSSLSFHESEKGRMFGGFCVDFQPHCVA